MSEQKTTQAAQEKVENNQGNVSSANAESIHYEDGKIQKKQYGGSSGQGSALKQVFIHLIENTKNTVETHIVKLQPQLTIKQLCTLLEQNIKKALNNASVKNNLENQSAQPTTKISQLLGQNTEIYLFYDQTKAIIKQKASELQYTALTKYSFIDDKSKVKIYIELPDIGALPAQKITSRFLEWSIQVKIHDYKGKNWIFAVPKTQCLLKPKQSKVIQKDHKLIISIGKNADADNWFSLYKVKMVGERDQ